MHPKPPHGYTPTCFSHLPILLNGDFIPCGRSQTPGIILESAFFCHVSHQFLLSSLATSVSLHLQRMSWVLSLLIPLL
jgi:hypothetical protein